MCSAQAESSNSRVIELGWYVPQSSTRRWKARWVLASMGGYVLYGTGGVQHKECRDTTFRRWQKLTKAERKSQQ
jgi:hypothetical protein